MKKDGIKESLIFKSKAFAAIHSSASALHKVGVINKTTMKEYDALCIKKPTATKTT